MFDYDAPFRIPDSYYDPPENEVCPKCAASECDDAIRRAVTDALEQFGVWEKTIKAILDDPSTDLFFGDCYAAVKFANEGKLCQDHRWEDRE